MFHSLKDLATSEVTCRPFDRKDGYGDKKYSADVTILAYIVGKSEVITDKTGTQVVSNTQLYVDASVDISEEDIVVLNNVERDIRSITTYYWNSVPDMKVVYL